MLTALLTVFPNQNFPLFPEQSRYLAQVSHNKAGYRCGARIYELRPGRRAGAHRVIKRYPLRFAVWHREGRSGTVIGPVFWSESAETAGVGEAD